MFSRAEIFTLPNAITGVRALGIPLFLWSYLSVNNIALAFTILLIGALSDYFDGKIARALNQESALGAILDPAIDRAYIAATVIALVAKEIVPLWLLILLIGRDFLMGLVLLVKRSQGTGVFEVTFLGKAATFNLLYAFPFLLLTGDEGVGRACFVIGWAFAIWGVGLYLITAFQYIYIAFIESRGPKSARI